MPKVPGYEAPQVRPEGIPNARVQVDSRGAFGEQLGQGVDAAVGASMDVLHAKQQADVLAVTNQETVFQGHANDSLRELTSLRGLDAVAAAPHIHEDLLQRQRAAMDGLSNDNQRRIFQMRTNGLVLEAKNSAEKYAQTQGLAAKEATAAALQSTALDAGASNYMDPAARAKYLAQPEGPIRALALSPEEAEANVATWRRRFHSTVLNQYLANNDATGAQAYLSQARDELGQDAPAMEHRVAALKEAVEGGVNAQGILAATTDATGRTNEAAAFAEWNKLPEGPVKKATEEQLKARLSLAKSAWAEQEQERLGRVLQGVERSGGYVNQSSADYRALSDWGKSKALERSRTLQRTDRVEQNQKDSEELRRFGALLPEDRATVDINTQFTAASQTARYQMQAQQNDVKSKLAKGQAQPLKDFENQVRATAVQLGLPKPDAEDLKAQMDSWYLEHQREGGKMPTRQEVEQELATALQHRKGWFFGMGGDYRFQAPQDEGFQPSGEQPYDAIQKRATEATPAATTAPSAPATPAPLPAGVKRGKDGNLYQKTPGGWVPYHG
jgi:hypothetical protein